MYDIIGDIHGCAPQLKDQLNQLGYRHDEDGVYPLLTVDDQPAAAAR